VLDTVCMRFCEIFIGKRFEVGGGDEDGYTDEVVVEEVIERGAVIIAAQKSFGWCEGGVEIGIWKRHVVDFCKAEEQRGWERAFYVEMVLAFGEGVEKFVGDQWFAHPGWWQLATAVRKRM
jgi:hypothetical protein